MSDLHRLQARGLSIDEMDVIVTVASQLAGTRQLLYTYMTKQTAIPLDKEFESAEAAYQLFCVRHGLSIHPLFDETAHRRQKVAEGDPMYLELYGADFPEERDAFWAKMRSPLNRPEGRSGPKPATSRHSA